MAGKHIKVMASLHEYGYDGDIHKAGMFLHFGEVRVHVADDLEGFRAFRTKLEQVEAEFVEHHGLE